MSDLNTYLARWADAHLIDAETAERIRTFEAARTTRTGPGWPVLIALAFGGLMLAGGVLLFVAAHWHSLSPGQRLGLVTALVAAFHAGGAFAGHRSPALSATLHAIGTAALGGCFELVEQFFHLENYWPTAMLLWAAGAGIGWVVLRQLPQLALVAVLTPAWLVAEWARAIGDGFEPAAALVAATGLVLVALAYLAAVRGEKPASWRRTLQWIGALALLPLAVSLALASTRGWQPVVAHPAGLIAVGWVVAIGVPLVLALALRGRDAAFHAGASVWAVILAVVEPRFGTTALYLWWAAGAIGLVAWGIRDSRDERVNLGAALFAATVFSFYFSQVMDKVNRSLSLAGLGILFLAGGWALERGRRRLILQARERALSAE